MRLQRPRVRRLRRAGQEGGRALRELSSLRVRLVRLLFLVRQTSFVRGVRRLRPNQSVRTRVHANEEAPRDPFLAQAPLLQARLRLMHPGALRLVRELQLLVEAAQAGAPRTDPRDVPHQAEEALRDVRELRSM